MNKVYLRPGKEKPIRYKHHWIFSGAIDRGFDFPDGEIASVYSSSHEFLGFGYFNRKPRTLTGRMISFEKDDPLETLKSNIKRAVALRLKLFELDKTNCFRVINGEGDSIPGLVVDKYNDVLVIQVGSLGIEKLKDLIVAELVNALQPSCVYEKSNMPSRREEGLESFEGYLYGKEIKDVEVIENNVKFIVDLKNSHKTGLYLDQREMRRLVGELANGKDVLNCFSYTGGFSLYAAMNKANSVTSIDISKEVIEQAKRNFTANGLNPDDYKFLDKDVFEYLADAENLNYDLIILDPPAFAKKKSDYENALKGYKKINKDALKKIKPNSFLLTCSCSYNVDEDSFRKVIMQAAGEAHRQAKIISTHRLAMDHVYNIFHPELNYLKCLLMYVE